MVERRVVLGWQVVVVEMVVMHSHWCTREGGEEMGKVSMVVVLVLVLARQPQRRHLVPNQTPF